MYRWSEFTAQFVKKSQIVKKPLCASALSKFTDWSDKFWMKKTHTWTLIVLEQILLFRMNRVNFEDILYSKTAIIWAAFIRILFIWGIFKVPSFHRLCNSRPEIIRAIPSSPSVLELSQFISSNKESEFFQWLQIFYFQSPSSDLHSVSATVDLH